MPVVDDVDVVVGLRQRPFAAADEVAEGFDDETIGLGLGDAETPSERVGKPPFGVELHDVGREKKFTPLPQEDLRSCILKRLGQAASKVNELRSIGITDVELVFVSDMIEECQITPLGHQMIRLTHTPLNVDVTAIRQFREHPGLGKARVTIIVPRSLYGTSAERISRPDIDELEQYWRVVFSACNVGKNSFTLGPKFPNI